MWQIQSIWNHIIIYICAQHLYIINNIYLIVKLIL